MALGQKYLSASSQGFWHNTRLHKYCPSTCHKYCPSQILDSSLFWHNALQCKAVQILQLSKINLSLFSQLAGYFGTIRGCTNTRSLAFNMSNNGPAEGSDIRELQVFLQIDWDLYIFMVRRYWMFCQSSICVTEYRRGLSLGNSISFTTFRCATTYHISTTYHVTICKSSKTGLLTH